MSGNVLLEKKRLPQKQMQALAILAAGGNASAAARAAQVDERTIRRWLAEPEFRRTLFLVESETVRGCARRLGGMADKALAALEDILDDPKTEAGPRIRAAVIVLDVALRWREQVVLDERITTVENHLARSPAADR